MRERGTGCQPAGGPCGALPWHSNPGKSTSKRRQDSGTLATSFSRRRIQPTNRPRRPFHGPSRHTKLYERPGVHLRPLVLYLVKTMPTLELLATDAYADHVNPQWVKFLG